MKLVWATDIHLNFVPRGRVKQFCSEILELDPEAVLLCGDIAEARDVVAHLRVMEDALQRPIYFVLGNHDYYHGSIGAVREEVATLSRASRLLHHLPTSGLVGLTTTTCLLGHGGWADGRTGDYWKSEVMLNDYHLIRELSGLDKKPRLGELGRLGDEAADYLRVTLSEALSRYRHAILLTHVPPFVEACWHEGNLSNDDFLPHFCCKATGDVLLDVMGAHPDRTLTVLCGHTHSSGMCHVAPNLFVKTGGAKYGEPAVQDPILLR